MESNAPRNPPGPARACLRHARRALAAARRIGGRAWEDVLQAFWREEGVEQAVAARAARLPLAWLALPAVEEHHRRLMFGGQPDRYRHLVDYAAGRWGGRLPREGLRVLCLGVSAPASLERMALEVDAAGEVVTVDPDPELVEQARQRLAREEEAGAGVAGNVLFRVLDPERQPLPEGPFHLVLSRFNLHRFAELEFVFDNVERVLDPVGVFAALEYTGPNRLQYPERQLALVNALLQLLPEERRTGADGLVKEWHARPPLAGMLAHAPGCAKRSEDILAVLRSRLKELELIPLGGGLLGPLLDNIEGCFRSGSDGGEPVLRGLIEIERILLERGMLASDYTFVVARRRATR